jgi:hypothetical protein
MINYLLQLGDAGQTEEVAEENKSLIVHLLKQVRPGMDLSKVILPTFILEPRSLLEKLSDYYHHCDILEEYVDLSYIRKKEEASNLELFILRIH